jgi:TorA maturation chaperone TorD
MNGSTKIDALARAHEILHFVSASRSQCYCLLTAAFSYPNIALVRQFSSGQFTRDFLQASAWLGDDQARLAKILSQVDEAATSTLEQYQAEYCRFFEKSIDRVSPREASYRWKDAGDLAGAKSDLGRTLQHQYSQYGLNCTPGMEDHIAAELEFLGFLCDREAMFWERGAAKTARGLRSQQRTFVDDHLSRWLPEFCHRLKKRAAGSIYGQLACLCDEWFSLDQGQGYDPIVD